MRFVLVFIFSLFLVYFLNAQDTIVRSFEKDSLSFILTNEKESLSLTQLSKRLNADSDSVSMVFYNGPDSFEINGNVASEIWKSQWKYENEFDRIKDKQTGEVWFFVKGEKDSNNPPKKINPEEEQNEEGAWENIVRNLSLISTGLLLLICIVLFFRMKKMDSKNKKHPVMDTPGNEDLNKIKKIRNLINDQEVEVPQEDAYTIEINQLNEEIQNLRNRIVEIINEITEAVPEDELLKEMSIRQLLDKVDTSAVELLKVKSNLENVINLIYENAIEITQGNPNIGSELTATQKLESLDELIKENKLVSGEYDQLKEKVHELYQNLREHLPAVFFNSDEVVENEDDTDLVKNIEILSNNVEVKLGEYIQPEEVKSSIRIEEESEELETGIAEEIEGVILETETKEEDIVTESESTEEIITTSEENEEQVESEHSVDEEEITTTEKQDAGIYFFLNSYQQKLTELQNEDYQKDIQMFEAAQKQFQLWKGYIIKMNQIFENFLHYPFSEVLEKKKYQILKDRRVILIPAIDDVNKLKSVFQNLAKKADEVDEINALLEQPLLNIRKTSDLDFRLDDQIDSNVLSFLKNKINTIIVIYKQMEGLRKKLLDLLNTTFNLEEKLQVSFEKIDTDTLIQLVLSQDLEVEVKEEKINHLLSQTDHIISTNFQKAQDSKTASDKIEKSYFDFLTKTIFRSYNSLRDTRNNFLDEIKKFPESKELLDDWSKIYSDLLQVVTTFLQDHLDIQVMETKVGDDYKDELHNPFVASEKDESGLKTNQIKDVINVGFEFDNGSFRKIIKQADVQVVNND